MIENIEKLLIACEEAFPRGDIKGRHHITYGTEAREGEVILHIWVHESPAGSIWVSLKDEDLTDIEAWVEKLRPEVLKVAGVST